jgi:hypothetical protein
MIKNEYIFFLANVLARVFYFLLEGEDMKLIDHLSKEQIKQLNDVKSPKKAFNEDDVYREFNVPGYLVHELKKEKVNWEEIMGMNRDIYTRKNGAVRRK